MGLVGISQALPQPLTFEVAEMVVGAPLMARKQNEYRGVCVCVCVAGIQENEQPYHWASWEGELVALKAPLCCLREEPLVVVMSPHRPASSGL